MLNVGQLLRWARNSDDARKLAKDTLRDFRSGRYQLAAARLNFALRSSSAPAVDTLLSEAYEQGRSGSAEGDRVVEPFFDYRESAVHLILTAFDSGDPDTALEWTAKTLERFPNDPGLLTLQGLALEFQGRYSQALDVYTSVVDMDPGDPAALYRRAATHVAMGNEARSSERTDEAETSYELALRDYGAALELDASAQGYLERAQIELDMDRVDDALRDVEEALKLDPGHVEAHYLRASVLAFLGRTEEALEDYGAVIRATPDAPQAYLERGRLRASLLESAEAEADFTRAIELAPTLEDARYERAVLRLDTADEHVRAGAFDEANVAYEGALADADAVLAWNPEALDAHWYRGLALRGLDGHDLAADALRRYLAGLGPADDAVQARVLAELGEAQRLWGQALDLEDCLEQAVASLRDAVRLAADSPELDWVRAALGTALADLGRFDAALEAFDAALAGDPELPGARLGRAKVLLRVGRFEESLAEFAKAAEGPQPALAQLGRGQALERLGRAKGALDAYAKALAALGGSGVEAYITRGALFEEFEAEDAAARAEEDYRAALSVDPASAEAHNALAWFYVEREHATARLEEAADLAAKAVELAGSSPWRGFYLDTLGWSYYKLDRIEDAVRTLSEAKELAPYRLIRRAHLDTATAAAQVPAMNP